MRRRNVLGSGAHGFVEIDRAGADRRGGPGKPATTHQHGRHLQRRAATRECAGGDRIDDAYRRPAVLDGAGEAVVLGALRERYGDRTGLEGTEVGSDEVDRVLECQHDAVVLPDPVVREYVPEACRQTIELPEADRPGRLDHGGRVRRPLCRVAKEMVD